MCFEVDNPFGAGLGGDGLDEEADKETGVGVINGGARFCESDVEPDVELDLESFKVPPPGSVVTGMISSGGSRTAESMKRSTILCSSGDTSAGVHCSSSTSFADRDIRP
jgi:hypothetical protein